MLLDVQNMVPQLVEIQGYKARAVTIFWDLIKGFNELLTTCQDYTILSDMLLFADFYDIHRLNNVIFQQIDKVKVGKENLIPGMAAVEKLEKLDIYKNNASTLEKRCIEFTESTYRSAKTLGLLVTKNSDNIDLTIRLLDSCSKMNAYESKCEELIEYKHCFNCKYIITVKCHPLPQGSNLLCSSCSQFEYKQFCKCNKSIKCQYVTGYCYSESVKSRCCNLSICSDCFGFKGTRYCKFH